MLQPLDPWAPRGGWVLDGVPSLGAGDVATARRVARVSGRAQGATVVLLTLATGQFLMALDSSVMNVAIATVAEDVGTTVSGIQAAITPTPW